MRDYEAVLKQARTCANRKYCDIGGNCEYYDAGVCCQGGEKDILNEAADAIEELVAAVPKWISVEEQLPEVAEKVLTYNGNYVSENWMWTIVDKDGKREMWAHSESFVTHWMPLPEPPKEDANENHS